MDGNDFLGMMDESRKVYGVYHRSIDASTEQENQAVANDLETMAYNPQIAIDGAWVAVHLLSHLQRHGMSDASLHKLLDDISASYEGIAYDEEIGKLMDEEEK